MLVGHVDDASLDRLVALAVDLADDHLGPADLQLVALAAHRLDEHGELELAAAGDLDARRASGVLEPDRHVAEHLAVEAVAQVAGGEVRAVLAGERRGVHAEGHAQHRLVDDEARQRHGVGRVGERVADLDLGEAGDARTGRRRTQLVDVDAARCPRSP